MSVDKLIATAPETIWLCVSDDHDHYREPFPKNLDEVTWAVDHCPVCCGVKYVRSDVQARQLRREVALLRQVERSAKEAVYYIAGPMEQAIQIKQELSDALKALEAAREG